jgi:aminoglycoside phosphotransferase (APT) family kinase protein
VTGAAGPLPFDAPRFAELRRMLDGVDLARAEDLGRGLHVTAYRAGDWVVRIPETDRARRTTARQAQLYRILAGLGLAVPRDARTAHDDAGVVTAGIYRWIDGDRACAERRTDRLAGDLGRFLATLHGVPLAAVAACCDVIDDPCRRFARCWERCHAHLPA